jgi:hypothetical protein
VLGANKSLKLASKLRNRICRHRQTGLVLSKLERLGLVLSKLERLMGSEVLRYWRALLPYVGIRAKDMCII